MSNSFYLNTETIWEQDTWTIELRHVIHMPEREAQIARILLLHQEQVVIIFDVFIQYKHYRQTISIPEKVMDTFNVICFLS